MTEREKSPDIYKEDAPQPVAFEEALATGLVSVKRDGRALTEKELSKMWVKDLAGTIITVNGLPVRLFQDNPLFGEGEYKPSTNYRYTIGALEVTAKKFQADLQPECPALDFLKKRYAETVAAL